MTVDKNASFSSERLSYRGISRGDAGLIVSWRSDPENLACFFDTHPPTLESHLAWFEGYLGDPSRLDLMIIDGEGRGIGTVTLSAIGGGSCEVGYLIGDRSARGRGYASEAVRAACRYAFDVLGVERVDARIKPGNAASERAAAGGGFVEHEHVWRLERPRPVPDEQREHGADGPVA
ncbi:GNAT family N-acetyltransferase [Collinsella tanakaei]|nr:GNAT family N-acetyltransferase [Collinsella tanakaei]